MQEPWKCYETAAMLSLNNPSGLWALLGIPAVLLIHFLQRKSQVVPISTLFLLDQLHRESMSGRRFERLRSSVPLWLQLLAVLCLTWLLVQPRWLEKGSVQRITVVLDGSASMQASKSRLLKELPVELRKIAGRVATTEYILLDTLMEKESLYHGTSLDDLEKALAAWEPEAGAHDSAPALRLGRSLADKDGLLVFATDHPLPDVPFNARVYSAGESRDNVGFAGLTLEEKDGQLLWKATLKNYGKSQQARKWWTEMGAQKSGAQSALLEPGQSRTLQGLFPPGADSLTIRLDPDVFLLDDQVPVLRPEPKKLNVKLPEEKLPGTSDDKLYQQVFASLPGISLTIEEAMANLLVVQYDALAPAIPAKPAILFVRDARSEMPAIEGTLLVEPSTLMKGLNWQSLLCLDTARIPAKPGDEVLLWQGERPLIFLRGEGIARQLCFNFDLRKSNARKLPAFIVLIHRYLDALRADLPLREVENYECAQKLRVASVQTEGAKNLRMVWSENGLENVLEVPPSQAPVLKAPVKPGVFQVRQGEVELVRGAAHFADTREADLSRAAPFNGLEDAEAALADRFSREDSHWRLWMLLLLVTLVVSWWFVRRVAEPARETAATPMA